jgi:hypothetical protein
MNGHTFKVNNGFYVASKKIAPQKPSPDNILLCQYDMIDTAVFIKAHSPDVNILLHNSADNNKPCGGLWNSNSDESQLYNRTNIKDLVLPLEYKLYPIQDDKRDNVGNYSINIIITKNCKVQKTSDNKDLALGVYIDVASLDAVTNPPEKNMDLYSSTNDSRFDYAKVEDRDKMEQKIKFLLTYAIGEGYDYLIVGPWGIKSALNPHWGLINLWNKMLQTIPFGKLKIIFCMSVQNDPDGESIYTYKQFNQYLWGQQHHNLDFNKINDAKNAKKEIEKLSEDEEDIKRKIYGIIWGMALGEIISYYYNNNQINADAGFNKWKIMQSSYTMDWDACTDQTVIMMRVMYDCDMDIDLNTFAKYLVNWKSVGFKELTQRSSTCTDNMTKYILSQSDYLQSPIDVARRIYMEKGANDESSTSIGRNAIMGMFKDYARRTIQHCLILQPDTACHVACLVHSFIINYLWNGKYITNQDWSILLANCHKIFDRNIQSNIQHKINFDRYWSLGRNYQYQITSGMKDFIEKNMTDLDVNHTFFPMTLAIIVMYDIQGHLQVNGKPCREMMSVTEIPALDDHMRDKAHKFHDALSTDYYFITIETLAAIHPNNVCNAVIGSILGLACWNNVYNDEVMRDELGNIIESDSQQWIKYAGHAEWLNNEINKFSEKYLDCRRRSILKKREIERQRLIEEEKSRPPVDLYGYS